MEQLQRNPELLELALVEDELATRIAEHRSREDPNYFAEYVFQQKQHPYHRLLQTLASEHSRLCIDAPIEHGKTTQYDLVRTTWCIGRNPNEMCAIISNSGDIPERAVRAIRDTLDSNERYQGVFPNVVTRKATQSEIWIDRPGSKSMHPTVVGKGVMGSIIGSRITLLILDDILDFQNTFSEGERRKLWDLLNSTILNRLVATGRLIDIGTPWHIEDARHKLRRMPGYTYVHFDAEDGDTYKINGDVRRIPGGQTGTLWNELWTDPLSGLQFGWPTARLAERKEQMAQVPHEWARQFRCVAISGSLEVFPRSALEYAKSIGKTIVPARAFKTEVSADGRVRRTWRPQEEDGDIVVTGVDLAFRKKDAADLTALFTLSPKGGLKRILEVCAGRMEAPDIVRQMIRIVRLYPGHRGFRVEDNGAQIAMLQVMRSPEMMRALGATESDLQRISLRNHETTSGYKWDPVIGIRGMAAYFAEGKWPIPADERDRCPGLIEEWYDAMVGFDPTSHTNDILMASWMAAEEARSFGSGNGATQWDRFGLFVSTKE